MKHMQKKVLQRKDFEMDKGNKKQLHCKLRAAVAHPLLQTAVDSSITEMTAY